MHLSNSSPSHNHKSQLATILASLIDINNDLLKSFGEQSGKGYRSPTKAFSVAILNLEKGLKYLPKTLPNSCMDIFSDMNEQQKKEFLSLLDAKVTSDDKKLSIKKNEAETIASLKMKTA